ncbi:hypothetical protein ACJX0J_013665, partial [Zea mays]
RLSFHYDYLIFFSSNYKMIMMHITIINITHWHADPLLLFFGFSCTHFLVSLALFAAILEWLGRVARKLNFGLPCIFVMYHFLLQGVTLKNIWIPFTGFVGISLCFLISSVRINSYFLPTQYAQSPFFLTGIELDAALEALILEPIKFTQAEYDLILTSITKQWPMPAAADILIFGGQYG